MKKTGGTSGNINALRDKLKEAGSALGEGLEGDVSSSDPPKTVREGDAVLITTLNTRGTVLAPPDSKGEVQVQAGHMKTRVPLTSLRLLEEKAEKKKTTVYIILFLLMPALISISDSSAFNNVWH